MTGLRAVRAGSPRSPPGRAQGPGRSPARRATPLPPGVADPVSTRFLTVVPSILRILLGHTLPHHIPHFRNASRTDSSKHLAAARFVLAE